MCRRTAFAAFLTTTMLLWGVSPTPAAEEVLKLVPESASAVVLVNRPADTDVKIQQLGQAMQLPVPSLLGIVKQRLNLVEGFDESRAVGLVVLGPKDGGKMPAAMLLIPVSDYDKFLAPLKPEDAAAEVTKVKAFDTTLSVRHVGGYAVLTEMSHRELLAGLRPSRKVPDSLASWEDWLAAGDVAGLLLRPGVEHLAAKVQEEISQIKAVLAAGGARAQPAAAGLDLYAQLFLAAEKEVSTVGLRLQLEENHVVRVAKRVAFVPGGDWARLAEEIQPPKAGLLEGLPAETFVLAGGGAVSDAMWQAMMESSVNLIKSLPELYGISEEQAGKLAGLSAEPMKGTRAIAMLLGAGSGDEPVYSCFVGTMQVDDSREFMAGYEKYVEQYSELVKDSRSPILQPLRVEKSEVDGTPALVLTMNAPQMPGGLPKPLSDRFMGALFGPGGKVVAYVAAVDKHHVAMGYVNQDRLIETIKAIKAGDAGLAGDADVKTTAALLPADAAAVAYLSPRGTIQFVRRIIPMMSPEEANIDQKMPDFPKTPPIGFAVRKDSGALEASMVVPGEFLLAIQPYIMKVVRAGRGTSSAATYAPAPAMSSPKRRPPNDPLVLDVAPFYNTNEKTKSALGGFLGRQEVDGLPFAVEGQARLWGEEIADRNPKSNLSETWSGIAVGRPFEELHLIHYAMWPDVEGQTIAYHLLNYADGTKAILPVRYGDHVLDWFYLPAYDQDAPTDADTKICWRGPPMSYEAPVRLFKTKLTNPSPDKVVETIDVVSARSLSTYVLVAATTADSDPDRPFTPPVPAAGPERNFDGKLTLHVLDAATGKPLAGVLVRPGMRVSGQGVVGQPLVTSASGETIIRYPTDDTDYISVRLTKDGVRLAKDGYASASHSWQNDIPDSAVFRLQQVQIRQR